MEAQHTEHGHAQYDESKDSRFIDTVVMSGGAPQSPLMAGFLYAMYEAKKTFLNFHTSGAGALMALLFIAPKKGDPGEALQNWVEAGVADEIYRVLPQNFKLFHKPGPFSPILARLADRYKIPVKDTTKEGADAVADFMAEMVGSLEDYNSKLGLSLRKDPIEQMRDLWRSMAGVGPGADLRKKLLGAKDPIRRLREMWLTSWFTTPEQQRFYNDMIDLWFSAITPSTLSSKSLGLAAPLPFLEEIVDFENLADYLAQIGERVKTSESPKGMSAHFCVNAYNMTANAKLKDGPAHGAGAAAAPRKGRKRWQQRDEELNKVMEYFVVKYDPDKTKAQIRAEIEQTATAEEDREHVLENGQGIRAAFSMPFIYPPAQIGDDFYSEGADHRPINFRHTDKSKEPGRFPIVLLDVLGELEDQLVRKPRDLWDSYVISIMTPVVALASLQISEFKEEHPSCDEDDHAAWRGNMLTVRWKIPTEAHPFVMDWSYSNLSKLFEVGKRAGDAFVARYGHRLRDRGVWTSLR